MKCLLYFYNTLPLYFWLHILTHLFGILFLSWVFPSGSEVKNPPANAEMQFWSLGRADPLEKEMATHSSILAWEIPWTEEPGRVQSMGLQRVRRDSATKQQQQNQILSYHFLLGIGKITQSFLWQCWLMYMFLKIII